MKFLLDTHVWIWAYQQSNRLGPVCKQLLVDLENERWISSVSTLEIARLEVKGQITLHSNIAAWVKNSMSDLLIQSVDLNHEIAIESYQLPGAFHADPADRILVATARVHGCTLLTCDRKILGYPHVKVLDAGI